MIPNYIARRPIDIPLRSPGASLIVEVLTGSETPLFKTTEGEEPQVNNFSVLVIYIDLFIKIKM